MCARWWPYSTDLLQLLLHLIEKDDRVDIYQRGDEVDIFPAERARPPRRSGRRDIAGLSKLGENGIDGGGAASCQFCDVGYRQAAVKVPGDYMFAKLVLDVWWHDVQPAWKAPCALTIFGHCLLGTNKK